MASLQRQRPKTIYPTPPPESDPVWARVDHFLHHFHGSIFCYLPDAESEKSLPPIHSDVVDFDHQKEGYGVFYSVNGFKSTQKRTKQNLLSLNAFYVDIDWPKERLGDNPDPGALAAFKRDALQALSDSILDNCGPTHIIETKNGLHALWCLTNPIIPENLQTAEEQADLFALYDQIQLAIIDRFQGDPQAKDVARVLRLPNTYHLKNPNSPFLVRFADAESKTTCETYTLEEIQDYFLSTPSKKSRTLDTQEASSNGSEELYWQSTGAGADSPLSRESLETLARTYPKIERPSIQALLVKDGLPPGRRNHSLLIAASAMRESGQSEAEVLSYFDHYNGLSVYEIGATVRSAFRSPEPYSFGWNDPIVAGGMTEIERTKVTSILADTVKKERKERERINDTKNKKQNAEVIQAEKTKEMEQRILASPHTEVLSQEQATHAMLVAQARAASEQKTYQKALFDRYEHVILERYPHLRYCLESAFYDYQDGEYVQLSKERIRGILTEEMSKDNLFAFRTQTNIDNKILCLKAVKSIQVGPNEIDPNPNIVNVKNGLVNLTTGEIAAHTPEYFSTNMLPITFRGDTLENLCPRWLNFINEVMLGDIQKSRFLQQMAGYCFTRNTSFQCAFILLGAGANGKSTFIDTIMRILGPKNTSSLNLKDLHAQFGTHRLFNKTLNVIEEISGSFFESDMIKKIITGSEVTADRKFLDALVFRPYAKFVFAVNQLPRINDTSTGLYRRFHIVDFLADFSKSADQSLAERLWSERDGIFLWCLKGWQDVISTGGLFPPPSVQASTELFKEANSPLVEFLLREYEIWPEERAQSFVLPLLNVFQAYQVSVKDLGYQPKNYQNFCKEMHSLNHAGLHGIKFDNFNGHKVLMGLSLKSKTNTLPTGPSFKL